MQVLTIVIPMVTLNCIFITAVILGVVIHFSYVETNGREASKCLQECLRPILKFEHSFTFQFRNFEKVCEKLESSAYCSQKCSPDDQYRFYHFTTFYRLHCIDFYEELENQLDCLKKASPNVDKTCNEQCTFKRGNNESQMKLHCRTLKCSLICYYKKFSSICSETHDTLLRLSMRQINDIRLSTSPDNDTDIDCRQLHNGNYMKQKMLEVRTE